MRRESLFAPSLSVICLCLGACSEELPTKISPSARPEIVDTLRQDLATQRHPSDGGGRAWLQPDPAGRDRVSVGQFGRWTFVYEAGPLGIAEDGLLFLQVSPFWGWSTPQVLDPQQPGFTEVSTDSSDLTLEALTIDQQLLGIRIGARALVAGERIKIVYGAGDVGARADRYAESESRFWFAVDGDGDGIRQIVADSPTTPVRAGPPSMLWLTLPSTASLGQRVRLTVAVLDHTGNAAVEFTGSVNIQSAGSAGGGGRGLQHPEFADFEAVDAGHRSLEVEILKAGTHRIEASGPDELIGMSNPMLVSDDAPRILWADLHGHSAYSDGTGTPQNYFDYARDIAALDVVALTDHDHWGIRPLSQHPEIWDDIQTQTRRYHSPGEFVTLLGYEWTNWIHGHRHVLYFDDSGEVLSSIDPAYESPELLWNALRGRDALTIAHHSAGGPIATNWSIPPDPELEPVTEVVSVHGSSEASDSPGLIYHSIEGNFVRDALDRGYRLGMIGSGDSHDGHPGLAQLASGNGGLAAILTDDFTRKGILSALRARRTYATNGPRIILIATLDGRPVGSIFKITGTTHLLQIRVIGTSRLARVELIKNGTILTAIPGKERDSLVVERSLDKFSDGDYLYLRIIQADGGAAWSSPFFFES